MLVIGRKLGEAVVLEPGGIRIVVTGLLSNGMVRLGIEAPERITILREELVGRYDRMKALAEKEERRRNWDKKQGGDA
jgi:carbon storage regulator CsrA